jgi:hypothetical protein
MLVGYSGPVDGVVMPGAGGVVDLPELAAKKLLANGQAELPAKGSMKPAEDNDPKETVEGYYDADVEERPAASSGVEKRPARGRTKATTAKGK